MALTKYNNLLTSGRLSTKGFKDAHILALVVVPQKLIDYSNNTSYKATMNPTKG